MQSLFAPASNLVFLTWMHLLAGGSLDALVPYVVVRAMTPLVLGPVCASACSGGPGRTCRLSETMPGTASLF